MKLRILNRSVLDWHVIFKMQIAINLSAGQIENIIKDHMTHNKP